MRNEHCGSAWQRGFALLLFLSIIALIPEHAMGSQAIDRTPSMQVREVMDRWVRALGGRQRIRRVRSVHSSGTTFEGGLPGKRLTSHRRYYANAVGYQTLTKQLFGHPPVADPKRLDKGGRKSIVKLAGRPNAKPPLGSYHRVAMIGINKYAK